MSSKLSPILRNTKRKRGSLPPQQRKPTSGHVSFGNDVKNNNSNTISSDHTVKSRKNKSELTVTSTWDDLEEDALDPRDATSDQITNQDRHIRQLKSARALRRATTNDKTLEGVNDDDTIKSRRRNDDLFHGEEEADQFLSLLHENDTKVAESTLIKGEKDQCPIEPFNMQSEREDGTGYFDGDTYIFRKSNTDHDDENGDDAWLDQLRETSNDKDEKNIVIESMTIQQNVDRLKTKSLFDPNMTKLEIYQHFLSLLASEKETVILAIRRYGSIIKREKGPMEKRSRIHLRNGDAKQNLHQIPTITTSSSQKLESLTELANICMMKFEDGNIYDRDRLYFQNYINEAQQQTTNNNKRTSYFIESPSNEPVDVKRKIIDSSEFESNNGVSPGKHAVQWEYRGNQDNIIHGPFSTKQMMEWIAAGYFVGSSSVDVRKMDEPISTAAIANSTSRNDEVNDLLNDLDSDDNDEEEKCDVDQANEWMRSDQINFAKYT